MYQVAKHMTFFPSSDKDALTVTFINEFLFDFYDCSSGFLKICDLISVSSRAPWKCVFVWFGKKKTKKNSIDCDAFCWLSQSIRWEKWRQGTKWQWGESVILPSVSSWECQWIHPCSMTWLMGLVLQEWKQASWSRLCPLVQLKLEISHFKD